MLFRKSSGTDHDDKSTAGDKDSSFAGWVNSSLCLASAVGSLGDTRVNRPPALGYIIDATCISHLNRGIHATTIYFLPTLFAVVSRTHDDRRFGGGDSAGATSVGGASVYPGGENG